MCPAADDIIIHSSLSLYNSNDHQQGPSRTSAPPNQGQFAEQDLDGSRFVKLDCRDEAPTAIIFITTQAIAFGSNSRQTNQPSATIRPERQHSTPFS
jgi:hypothetical protein